tara:strand:+ start:51 stop:797 length:747 start_codon:yes stop_codon:yes gene_type:complete
MPFTPYAGPALLTGSKIAGKFKDFIPLVKSSATGGLFSGGLTALFTGNPIAGLAVGAADTLGSAALATGLGALGTRKVLGKNINFAGGKKYTFSETDDLNPLKKQLESLGQVGTATRTGNAGQLNPEVMKNLAAYAKSKEYYSPSGPQLAGMYAGSIAAPFAIEPLFMPRSQNYITNSQSMQTYGMNQNINSAGRPTNNEGTVPTNSMGTQVMAGQSMNLAPGTLYQLPYSPLSNLSTAFAAQSENVM